MRKKITAEQNFKRLDIYLTECFPELSRTQIKRLCDEGRVLLNEKTAKAGQGGKTGDVIVCDIPEADERPFPEAEAIELDIIYEDSDLLIINKPRGMVVHPAPGHHSGTLVNAVLHHCNHDLSEIGGPIRPGIVHRIDKDTSGLLMVVKNDAFHRAVAALIKRHEVVRDYRALVWGHPRSKAGLIDAPIGRDPSDRQRMAVVRGGREARTHFELLKEYKRHSELALELETGRTHQIRVHLKYIGLPVIGDPVYAKGRKTFGMTGQALHAWRLRFIDPRDGREKIFEAPLPEDYLRCAALLEAEDR